MSVHQKFDTVILGGGFSGLYLALLLRRAGQRVAVLEKEDSFGGLLRTFSYKGFRFDLGGHRLVFGKDSDLNSFLREIGFTESLLEHRRRAMINVSGRFWHYPPLLIDACKLPWPLFFSAVKDFIRQKFIFTCPKTFEDWLCRQYGETIYRLVFKDYTKKVWGLDCAQIPPHLLKERVGRFLFLYSLLGLKSVSSKDTNATFFYPRRGIVEIIDALLAQLKGETLLFTSTQILGIRSRGADAPIIFFQSAGQESEITATHVVSTIPIPELIKISGVSSLMKLLPNYKSRHVMFFNLILKKPLAELPKFHWVYLPQGDLIFSRSYMPCVWSDAMAPEGRHSLSLEIICGNDLFALSDQQAIDLCVTNLAKTGFKIAMSDVEDFLFVRQANAYPVTENEAAIEDGKKEILLKFPFLRLLGRAGNHAYYDMEDCVRSARTLADELIGAVPGREKLELSRS